MWIPGEIDLRHLRRCIALAREAVAAGDEPFGSVLVDGEGRLRVEGRNRVVETGDATQHPEFELARWAAANMTPEERAVATVYTSGEHCPMCAGAHGWVGLGRVVYATSSAQLASWLQELDAPPPPLKMLRIQEIAPHVRVEGPVENLADEVKALHKRFYETRKRDA